MTFADYTVTMRFTSPAYDEHDGIKYEVRATSKSDAIKCARRRARDDGHMGRVTFTAKLEG